MAYQKRTYRKKTYKRKTNTAWYDKKYSTAQIAKKALDGVKYIKGLVNSEMLHFDSQGFVNQSNVPPLGIVSSIMLLAEGDDVFNRTGNSILLKSVHIKNRLTWNVVTPGTVFKYWVVQDNQQISDTAPAFSTIFNGRDVLSMMNRDFLGRFKILKTGEYKQDTTFPQIQFDIYLPLQQHVKFNGPLSTDIQKGGLYFVTSSSAGVANQQPFLLSDLRVSYHDN